ncbi:hypothetical protein HS088_TW11G00061 [Tripterygium wilfordii]|uniref:Calmodulin binding protein n=1 Tax=Tripterygium wilfordii TaxID=458696 RepID=A0A7J7D147_TRIWF|nr:calmodulin-binding protein 60 G-like [Tripterygium wilfordii]KAF5739998.1 hypothetical protein HS088_TW11G00061 [Tripterygium wilfordii]
MVSKRPFYGDGSEYEMGIPVQHSKRRNMFKNAVLDVMRGITVDEIVSRMEPLFRKVVREEIERLVQPRIATSPRSPLDQVEAFKGRGFLFHFVNKLPSTIFTGSRIEAEDNNPVQIVLLDAATRAIVTSGPLSSKRIEIVVLDGDFGSDEKEEWTEKEFNVNVVREREGKRPLVTGELSISLKNGVGDIGDVSFTDNSSWIRCRKFRLGVKVAQKTSNEVRIREGRSKPFMVKDHRGELYKKHHPPSLRDDIWRLERIAKDGAFHKRLALCGVQTVNDFLRLYESDPLSLRNMIGNQISSKAWETIVEHANECVPDEGKFYTYTGAAQSVRLLFNSIYKVIAATFDGQTYLPIEKLDLPQKLLVEDVKRQAYKNMKDLVSVGSGSTISPSMALANLQTEISETSSLQSLEFSTAHQDEPGTHLAFDQQVISAPYLYEPVDRLLKELYLPQNSHPMQAFNPFLRNSFTNRDLFPKPYNGENHCLPIASQGELVLQSSQALAEDIPPSLWRQGSSIFFRTENDEESDFISPFPGSFGVHMRRFGTQSTHKAQWCKIRAALKLYSVRRDVAAKRLAASPFYGLLQI